MLTILHYAKLHFENKKFLAIEKHLAEVITKKPITFEIDESERLVNETWESIVLPFITKNITKISQEVKNDEEKNDKEKNDKEKNTEKN